MGDTIDAELVELDQLACEIRGKLEGSHLNMRVVWAETLLPCIENARAGVTCTDARAHQVSKELRAALREFADCLSDQ